MPYIFTYTLKSEQIVNIHRHFIDFCRVVLLNIPEDAYILIRHEVYGDTSSIETARSTDSMDVELTRGGQVEADNETNLLHVKSSTPHISGDKNSTLARSEFFHDCISFFLWQTTVHAADRKVGLAHFLSEPLRLLALVAEDDGLSDRQRVI